MSSIFQSFKVIPNFLKFVKYFFSFVLLLYQIFKKNFLQFRFCNGHIYTTLLKICQAENLFCKFSLNNWIIFINLFLKELFAIPICNGHTYTTLSKICQVPKIALGNFGRLEDWNIWRSAICYLTFFPNIFFMTFERTFCNSDLQWAYLYHTFKNLSSGKFCDAKFWEIDAWMYGGIK